MAARLFAGAALGPAHWLPTAGGDGDGGGGPPLVAAAFTDSDTGVEGLGVLGLAPAGAAGAAGDVALEWRGSWEQSDHVNAVAAVALSATEVCVVAGSARGGLSGLRLHVGGGEDGLEVLQGADEHRLRPVPVMEGAIADVAAHAATREIAVAGSRGQVAVVADPFARETVQVAHDSHGAVSYTAVAWADAATVLAAGYDGKVTVLDKRASRPASQFSSSVAGGSAGGPGLVRCLAADGPFCATGHAQGAVAVWDARAGGRPLAASSAAPGDEPWGDVWGLQFAADGAPGAEPAACGTLLFGTQSGVIGALQPSAAGAPEPRELFRDTAAVNSVSVFQGAAEAHLLASTDAESLVYIRL